MGSSKSLTIYSYVLHASVLRFGASCSSLVSDSLAVRCSFPASREAKVGWSGKPHIHTLLVSGPRGRDV